jgi:hypothetical protein
VKFLPVFRNNFPFCLALPNWIREFLPVMTSHKQRRATLKRRLKANGWTQQAAADEIGVGFEQVNRVLNGHRDSASLLEKLEALPARGEAGVSRG